MSEGRLQHTRLHLAVALLSAALLAFQLILMQILSIVQWYHFAYMVISVALLGFGASGTVISLAREWLLKRFDQLLPFLMITCGAAISLAILFSQSVLGGFDSYLVFVESRHRWLLLATYLTFFLPFFIGAVAIGLVFVRHVDRIGSFYFANLVGSGAGGIIAIGLMWVVLPAQLPAVAALLPIAAGMIIGSRLNRALTILTGLSALSLCVILYVAPSKLNPSQYKSLSRALNLPEAKVVLQRNSPYGFVQMVTSPALRYAPGLSFSYRNPIPVRSALFNNGDWFGPLVGSSPTDALHMMDYSTISLPYAIGDRTSVLVLNSRTGLEVSHALTRHAERIVAVEPHGAITTMLKHELADANDSLLFRPELRVHALETRTHLLLDPEQYDLVTLPILETFGGSAGVFALQEQYLLTKEAFKEMWKRLTPEGVISISSWMDYPVRSPLKILATLVEVLEELDVGNPSHHLAAIRSWGTITFVVKRTPLTENEIHKIRAFCAEMMFDPALLPNLEPAERNRYNVLDDDRFFGYLDEIISPQRVNLYKEYDFDLRPATDDRPYFSQFLRWQSLPFLIEVFGTQSTAFLEIGYLIVGITFIQITLAALLLIILPLLSLSRINPRSSAGAPLPAQWSGSRAQTFLYFAGLGAGYMFVEIVLIQRFILYLGHPMYAAAVVIGFMLVSSGFGSYLSSRVPTTPAAIRTILLAAILLIAVYAVVLTPLLRSTIGLPMEMKIVLSLLIIAPPAFIMGFPFPLGLRRLSALRAGDVPWAWGINGCISVVSTALATIIAVEGGFVLVMLIAAGAYGAALVAYVSGFIS